MIRVKHPKFDTVVYEVPADDLHEWLEVGWIALDASPKPRRYRQNQTTETPDE